MIIQILIIFGVFILALIFVFRLVFRRDLDAALNRLKKLQEEAMIKENSLRDELERAKMERAFQVGKGVKEAKNLIAQAEKEAEASRSVIAEKAEQEKADVIEAGKEEVEKLKKNFTKEVQTEAVKFAVDIIQQVFTGKEKEHLQHHLTAEFLDDLEKIEKDKFSAGSNTGEVISPAPMTADEKKRLESILSDKTGCEIKLEEKTDPSLITGIVVKIGDFVIDGSLKNKLNKVIPYIKR